MEYGGGGGFYFRPYVTGIPISFLYSAYLPTDIVGVFGFWRLSRLGIYFGG